jgi:hypothetical protein
MFYIFYEFYFLARFRIPRSAFFWSLSLFSSIVGTHEEIRFIIFIHIKWICMCVWHFLSYAFFAHFSPMITQKTPNFFLLRSFHQPTTQMNINREFLCSCIYVCVCVCVGLCPFVLVLFSVVRRDTIMCFLWTDQKKSPNRKENVIKMIFLLSLLFSANEKQKENIVVEQQKITS